MYKVGRIIIWPTGVEIVSPNMPVISCLNFCLSGPNISKRLSLTMLSGYSETSKRNPTTVVVIDKIHCDRILSVEILGTQSLLGFVLNGQSQLLDHFRHKTARLENINFVVHIAAL